MPRLRHDARAGGRRVFDLETALGFHPLFPLLVPAALWIGLRVCGLLHMSRKRETAYILAFAGVFILVYLVRLLCGDR